MSGEDGLHFAMLVVIFAGAINMVILKFQHMQAAPMKEGGIPQPFDHPAMQAALMMVGEAMCLPVYYFKRTSEDAERSKRVPPWIFLVPCCCDLAATALLCTGLAFVAVSVAQMCRGTIIIFVCSMSVLFLGRKQHNFHLAGVSMVLVGIIIVALSVLLTGGRASLSLSGHPNAAFGIFLCIFAQVFQASMFVYEEKIMSLYPVSPLQVVGMEGSCGVVVSSGLLLLLSRCGIDDTAGALHQIFYSPALLASVFGSMLTVATFNTAGITVTQKSSATARTTVKISATVLIWFVELACGWNTFNSLQFVGFVFVVAGTLVYNKMVEVPGLGHVGEERPLNQQRGVSLAEKLKQPQQLA
eukprot:TRINITY_DN64464_c0_g1_i1.p1 TRINITY_DN64464_c0_g1~~TRINITY_DN64464_c0_g1_i1.p1  ORF type:complete len:357 (-),score=65.64 TRINITY_DN64464_c0_g1_i1:81-1151(-)